MIEMRPVGGRAGSPVELRDLTESRALRDLTSLYGSASTGRVEDVALISDIADITSVGPDTVVILTDEMAVGGWVISAALRYVWERRACALIVPEKAITGTAIELARRLDVSLLATRRDPTRMAIDVALQIGIARAGSVARVQAFTDRLADASSLPEAMTLMSRELGGARVRFESTRDIAFDVSEPGDRAPEAGTRVPVRVHLSTGESDAIVVEALEHERDYVEQLARASVPSFRALLTEARLKAIRESLPPIALATLTGWSRTAMLEPPDEAAVDAARGWPMSGPYMAVCVLTERRELLGAVVHQIWQRDFPEVPLAPIEDGWLALVPAAGGKAQARLVALLRDRMEAARGLGIMLGLSRRHTDAARSVDAVREAWLAARMADDEHSVVEFAAIPARLVGRLLPRDLAEKLASVLLPDLMADPSATDIVEAVVTFLAARGSVSKGAELLGVHRNTMQARIRRAEELGVSLSDPDAVLPLHIVLAAVARRSPGTDALAEG